MLIAIGTRVRLRNTGDVGVVREVLGDDLFTIYLTELDMEIPAFSNNLERLDSKKGKGAQFVKGKQPKAKPAPPPIQTQYQILTKKGLLLAFHPLYSADDSIDAFDIYLINDTVADAIYNFELRLGNRALLRQSQKINNASFCALGQLTYAQLNDSPNIHLSCWKVTTNGTGVELKKHFKIKPKNFFTRLSTAPLLNRSVHLFTLFEQLDEVVNLPKKAQEDLLRYTQQNTEQRKKRSNNHFYRLHDVTEFAEFSGEIDLHIHELVDDPSAIEKRDIIKVQLRHFDDFLAKAIRLGRDRCFVIHGIGKGKLRNEIAQRLQHHPEVADFKNEYHPNYGWGATEIIFK
ncbi:MAG: Smr/MutS family protein [Bacteroidota bacterium]